MTDAERVDEIRRRNVTSVAIHNQMQKEIGFAESAPYDVQFLLAQLDAANQTIAELNERESSRVKWRNRAIEAEGELTVLRRQVSELTKERDYLQGQVEKYVNLFNVGAQMLQAMEHAPRQEDAL